MLLKLKDNFCLIVCSLLICRSLYFGAAFGDALAILGALGLYGFQHYLESSKEPPINQEIKEKLAALDKEVKTLRNIQTVSTITKPTQFKF